MITFSLRRAGPAVAVIASLSIRAAAQGEADFFGALAAIPYATQRRQIPQKPLVLPVQAPSAPSDVWTKVLEVMKTAGEYAPGNGQRPDIFTITDVTGDTKADHVKRVFTVPGKFNKDGQFEAMSAVFVILEFKLDAKDGNWHIDRWMVTSDIYGEVTQAVHMPAVVSPEGEQLHDSEPNVKPEPDNSEIQAQYDAMLKYWAERKSK